MAVLLHQFFFVQNYTKSNSYLHDSNIVCSVDFCVFGKLLSEGGHRSLQMFSLASILLLDVSIHTGCLSLEQTIVKTQYFIICKMYSSLNLQNLNYVNHMGDIKFVLRRERFSIPPKNSGGKKQVWIMQRDGEHPEVNPYKNEIVINI